MRFAVLCSLLLAVFIAALAVANAQDSLLPKIPSADPSATQCVEPTDVMRRRHMDFILHQRDETVHKGVRTKKHSLVQCINCHIQPTSDGKYPRYSDSDHFCAGCHQYSSVQIDCFSCHADRPEKAYKMDNTTHHSRERTR